MVDRGDASSPGIAPVAVKMFFVLGGVNQNAQRVKNSADAVVRQVATAFELCRGEIDGSTGGKLDKFAKGCFPEVVDSEPGEHGFVRFVGVSADRADIVQKKPAVVFVAANAVVGELVNLL